ncbi:hypothetical protein SAMN04489712_111125 [Thermomonospora echinospora]|uniref:Uncharacterized protein n=1 Tax=Thermomonospora echinospora TaxID=1992 RepID=A0A1H6CSW9_9ACTN|nr:hypothetical protein [Thermomonospora echinospora]SEG76120.1 hypothetical protein SAMN04489712_111125 [Thermomonospora echinospora]
MGLMSVVRWVRAVSFAATCAVLATLGHLTGGGSLDRSAVLTGFLVIVVPALALTGRERTLASILPATAVSQVVLHVLLTKAQGAAPAPAAPAAPMGGAAGMEAMEHGTPGLGMLLMHAVSVLVTSAWLEWGEARLCALVRQLTGWVLRPLLFLLYLAAGSASTWPRPIVGARTGECAPVQAVLRYAVVRRGPPGTWCVPGAAA